MTLAQVHLIRARLVTADLIRAHLVRALVAMTSVVASFAPAPAAVAQAGAQKPATAMAAAQAHLADAPAIDRKQQRLHCEAELRALKRTSGGADGQSDQDIMKTCLADVNPAAVLPGAGAVMNAPVGSTGVCKDGTYSSAVRKEGACSAHGGLARWFGG